MGKCQYHRHVVGSGSAIIITETKLQQRKAFAILKGNVAVYKVLNLEMLLYKVRWHVSTVKECNLIARS